MLCHRGFVIAVTIISSSSISSGASAQGCDERYPWTCRGYGPPPIEAMPPRAPYWQREPFQPRDPFAPREIAPDPYQNAPAAPMRPREFTRPIDPAIRSQYAALYGPIDGEPFPIPAVNLSQIDPEYLRKSVPYPTNEPPGTIIIDAQNHFLYFIQGGGRALRYGVGVGRQGFGWSGVATIHDKREWPDWYDASAVVLHDGRTGRRSSRLGRCRRRLVLLLLLPHHLGDHRRSALRRGLRNVLLDQLLHARIARGIRAATQHDRDDVPLVPADR
jgi:hypothetical protein